MSNPVASSAFREQRALAEELLSLVEERKRIEKREKELKKKFTEQIGIGSLDLAGIVVQVIARARTSLDTEAVRTFLGDSVSQFERTISYTEVSVSEVRTVEAHPKALEGYLAAKVADAKGRKV